MAQPDDDVIPSYDVLEREAIAALRDIVRDKDAPAAARAAAVKELRGLMEEAPERSVGPDDPSEMTLAQIDEELSTLGYLIQQYQ